MKLKIVKIRPEAHLKDDLGLESLDFVDIAVIVQKEFGITLKGEEMTAIRTLQDLYDYIFTQSTRNSLTWPHGKGNRAVIFWVIEYL